MSKIIGIDLGTTNSCVAVMEGGEAVVIPNSEGARTTPSVVGVSKNGDRLIGQVAKRQAVTNYDNTVISIKRHMGSDYKAHMGGKDYTPQEISAMILQKLKADAEAYLGEKVTEAVTQFKDETKDVNLADVLNILNTEDTTAIQVAEGVTINAADYSTAMGFADLAIKQGEDYLYDMDGSLEAEANRDLASTDWQKLVQSANPDYDIAAAEADPSLLTELEPFTIPGSFLMQINPVTGDAEYIYEPELYFALPNSDEDEEEAEDDEEVRTSWTVEDETASEDTPNLVIRAEFKSMGPFAIFLPNDAQ